MGNHRITRLRRSSTLFSRSPPEPRHWSTLPTFISGFKILIIRFTFTFSTYFIIWSRIIASMPLILGCTVLLFFQESYTFTVGYHELTGSKVPLKKPLLVLKKVNCMDVDQSCEGSSAGTDLEVVGIIRHRILFNTRPQALISSTSKLLLPLS